jgi:hypothetical protein
LSFLCSFEREIKQWRARNWKVKKNGRFILNRIGNKWRAVLLKFVPIHFEQYKRVWMCGLLFISLRGEKKRSQNFYLTLEICFKPQPTEDFTKFSQRMMKPTFSSLLEDFTYNYNGCTNFSQYNTKTSYINSRSSVQKTQYASNLLYLVFGYNWFVTRQKT